MRRTRLCRSQKIRTDARKLMKPAAVNQPGFMSNPHLTVVRKLTPAIFENAWKEFRHKHFTAHFVAHRMILVRKGETDITYFPIETFESENLAIETTQGSLF